MKHPQTHSDLYTGSQCAAFDALAMGQWGFSADQLMQRAGEFAFAQLQQRWPKAQRICVCAGVGNNAGDGYVVARLALAQGFSVGVLQLHDRQLQGVAGRAQQAAVQAGVKVMAIELGDVEQQAVQAELKGADVVVDAMLGIGLGSAPRPAFVELIEALNTSQAPVLALDVPSGLDAEASAPFSVAVRANLTTTFIVDKLCLRTGLGKTLAGEVRVSHLGLPLRALAETPGWSHLRSESVRLPALAQGAYKHGRGHVVVVGGDHGMHGAVLLAAEAALRSGAGLVSVITRGAAISGLLARRPELMVLDAERRPQVLALLARATVIVCGPGLGQGAWGRALLDAVLASDANQSPPLKVFDADALNLLAGKDAAIAQGAVVTPHSGEAARLLGTNSAAVERDRMHAVQQLARRFAGVAVLKGPGSLIGTADTASVCAHGNPGMASAGMGDVLAGLCGGLLAQLLAAAQQPATLIEIAGMVTAAVVVHSAAADAAAERYSMRSLIASDLLTELPAVLALLPAQGE
ncbi:MAG: NAD(P)H-hydrate dehydratase [Pseudomonadales bacterium]